jgi:NADPH-dependent 2,4-dienoyl-CoA reductase/sulfur reductase-like enzyme/rhodanese-related sulfurtransferase
MDKKKIVVIGGVAAGPKAAARARRRDPNAEITIVDRGDLFSYAGCGMPFYIEGLIDDIKELMCTPIGVVRDASFFKKVKDIRVLGMTEAVKIDRSNKKLVVRNLQLGKENELDYDKLIMATGAYPITPPVDGIRLGRVYQLNKPTDAQAIRRTLEDGAKNIVIIGGGLIGLETCGAFVARGCQVTIIEMLDQILPGLLDPEIALLLMKYLKSVGVKIFVSEKVTKLVGDKSRNISKVLTEKETIKADVVIVAVGVKPDVALAKDSGIKLGETGAILVNEYLQTSDPDIFAGGDCVESTDIVTGRKVYAPLGSTANKHGRVIGDNVTGGKTSFPGISGTAVFRVLEYNVGKTGLNEKQATELGYETVTCLTPSPDCAHYYPGSKPFIMKLIADKKTGKIFGCQGIGSGEAIKRIDVLTTAIRFGATAKDFADLDLGYAPPYSTAIDAIAHAANVIRNKLDGMANGLSPLKLKDKMELENDFILLDVRTKMEIEQQQFNDKRVNWIPLGALRERFNEIPKDKEVIIYCKTSLRAYEAQRILESKGFKNVKFLEGGIAFWPFEL